MKVRNLSEDLAADPTSSATLSAEMEDRLANAFRKWGNRVVRSVREKATSPDHLAAFKHMAVTNVDGVPFDMEAYQAFLEALAAEELFPDSDPIIDEIWDKGAQSGILFAVSQLGAGGVHAPEYLTPQDRDVIKGLTAKGKAACRGVPLEVNKKIINELVGTYKAGGNINQETIDNIQTLVDGTDARARMIARTETMDAVNTGALIRYEQAGVTQVEWLTVEDEKTCTTPIEWAPRVYEGCAELDGWQFSIDDHPPCPAHPNCRCTLIPVIILSR